MASAHPRVLAALGRALSLELTAVQQYLTHASLLGPGEIRLLLIAFAVKRWKRCNTASAS